MKTLIFAVLVFMVLSAYSQTITPPIFSLDIPTWIKLDTMDYLAGGKVGSLSITVRNYDVYKTSSGQYYINFKNSSGVISRKYLGYKPVGGVQEYMNNTVFYNPEITKCWVWTVDRYGQIYKIALPDWMALDFKQQISNIE